MVRSESHAKAEAIPHRRLTSFRYRLGYESRTATVGARIIHAGMSQVIDCIDLLLLLLHSKQGLGQPGGEDRRSDIANCSAMIRRATLPSGKCGVLAL
jgi:hypothetical protein